VFDKDGNWTGEFKDIDGKIITDKIDCIVGVDKAAVREYIKWLGLMHPHISFIIDDNAETFRKKNNGKRATEIVKSLKEIKRYIEKIEISLSIQ